MGTAAIVRHTALLSTQLSLYSAVGVVTELFQLSRRQAVFLLPVHVLPFYNAARIDAAIVLQLSRRVLSVSMRFTVGGDAKHYTPGTSAAILQLLVHVLPFILLIGSMQAFIFFSAHVRTTATRYRAFTTVREDTALYSFE